MSYSKLRGRIREIFGTQEAFAKAMGMNTSTLSAKLNDHVGWSYEEAGKACELLGIELAEMHLYFFVKKL